MSDTPPHDPWSHPGHGDEPATPPPPAPGGAYPPPPPSWNQPPPPSYGQQPGGTYPPPPPSWQQPQPPYPGGPPGGGTLAGWWLRVGATVVDGLVLIIPNFILRAIGGSLGGGFLSLVLVASYTTILISRKGQTVGNMAVHTRVVDAQTGGPVSVGKALGRWAAEIVLVILFVIPWVLDILWPLWDRQNQTLHDKIAGTVVLRDQF